MADKQAFTPKMKRDLVKPLTITVTLTASRVNENGTFLGWTVDKVASGDKDIPAASLKVSAPPSGGGALYIKSETFEGVKIKDASTPKEETEKKKFF